MKTGIATVSISGNLSEKIDAIAAAGFSGIEIFEQDFIADTSSPREVGQRIRDAGLDIYLFQPFRDFEGLPPPLRARAFDRFERKFDLMQELGTDLVLVCSTVHPQSLGGIDRAADDFAELGQRAAKRNLRVGYEALAWGRHVFDHRDAWEIVRRADHENVGLILDSFHTLARKVDPESIRRIPADKIFFVQLADAPLIEMDLLYWSRHFRNMPGEGDLDLISFTRAVMATGYSGPLSLEIFNDQFRGGNSSAIAEDGHRSLMALMDDVMRTEPDLPQQQTQSMPARAKALGTSFVEFTARGEEADSLCALLTMLGFEKTGKHRNKAVTLWQQGQIKIVVNEETVGYAASAWLARGTSVCDIGLELGSAHEATQRAAALGVPAFPQNIAADDVNIPAIRGLAGSLLHFLDKDSENVWQTDFIPPEAANSDPDKLVAGSHRSENSEARLTSSNLKSTNLKGAGLSRIDHLGQTMSYAEMLSWSLFYTSLLDVDKTAIVDVIDPDGLVRSQAISSPDGAFRVTLNGADTQRTLAGALLAQNFGAPVQHIALATNDIFSALKELGNRGFEPLPMPKNYYEDLAARFGFSSETIQKLQSANVLYDRDEGGEFFQCYSKVFAGGLFFEIVQRDEKYAGYGAPNAPFRIAAQKRLQRAKGVPDR